MLTPIRRDETKRVKFMRLLVLWITMAAVIIGVSFLARHKAHGHTLVSGTNFAIGYALICDSPTQVQQVLHDALLTGRLDLALEKVNAGLTPQDEMRCMPQKDVHAQYVKDNSSFTLMHFTFVVIEITDGKGHNYFTFIAEKEKEAMNGFLHLAKDTSGRYSNWPPELKKWVKDLHSPVGSWCCDISDGFVAKEVQWTTDGKHYTVVINGEKVEVPDTAIINEPNQLGEAYEWHTYKDGKPVVTCFLPGTLG